MGMTNRRLDVSSVKRIVVWLATIGIFLVVNLWYSDPVQKTIKEAEIHKSNAEALIVSQPYAFQSNFSNKLKTTDMESWLENFKKAKRRPNVLFVVADDMRPDIKAYAHPASPWIEPHMVTPNLDRLASRGLLLRRAYCQQSWCNPSRSSFLTSRRPDTTMVHNNSVFFRQVNPNFITLPQYFKQSGYKTLGIGKIFHLMGIPGDGDDLSFTMRMPKPEGVLVDGKEAWKAIKPEDRHGKLLLDEVTTNDAIETLTKLAPDAKSGKQPFFLAVGMKKPHLSFVHPAEFQDYYPLNNVSLPVNPTAPKNMPDIAWFHSNEIRGRDEYQKETSKESWDRKTPLAKWVVRELRRAYYATISYVDSLVGKLFQKLEKLGVADDTIIAFIGDHGFHLGEHSIVGKNTNFEVANNSPMIIRIPGVTDNGLVSDKLVEFVDLFPTLADLAGLPTVPQCPAGVRESQTVNLCTEGASLRPLFKDPSTAKWKDSVFFQYPHYTGVGKDWCMGYSLRTEQYRYTEWVDYHYHTGANWTQSCGVELYDHKEDPHETINRADDSDLIQIRDDLHTKLKAGWSQAMPR